MKICLINNLFVPHQKGGAETVVKYIVEGLLKNNYEVVLITLGRKSERQMLSDKFQIYRIIPWNIFSYMDIDSKSIFLRLIWWFFNIFNFSANLQIKKILLSEKPDVVHTHNLTGIGFLVPRLIRHLNMKHIHTLHDIQLLYPSGQLIYGQENKLVNKNLFIKLYQLLTRWLVVSSGVLVISPSKWLMNFYNQRGFFKHVKKEILVNPVNVSNQEPTVVKLKSPIKLLYVGRIESYKGILFLLDVFRDLQHTINGIELHIIGDGPDSSNVRELIKDNPAIIFHGSLTGEELVKFYQTCQALIFPTLTYENCPMVILEAFSFGMPVMAANLGGIPELVKNYQTGWLFNPGDGGQLKKVLEKFATLKPAELAIIKANCLTKAKQFNHEKYIQELVNVYSL